MQARSLFFCLVPGSREIIFQIHHYRYCESTKFIGKIHSELNKIEECPLQENKNAPEASVIIYPEYADGIQNISSGSEILLFTWLNLADRKILKCKPSFQHGLPTSPNPIGFHSVKVLSATDNVIKVSGLEVLDQTPVVDIKPPWNESTGKTIKGLLDHIIF